MPPRDPPRRLSFQPPVTHVASGRGQFAQEFLDTDLEGFELLVAFVSEIGPNLLEPIVTPDALGIQVFTVLAEPPERIAGVIADIEALVAAGDLAAGQAQALIQVLRNALRSLERGHMQPTCSQLASFAKVAAAKVEAGALSPEAADALIAEVQSIMEQLGCDQPVGSPSGAFIDGWEIQF